MWLHTEPAAAPQRVSSELIEHARRVMWHAASRVEHLLPVAASRPCACGGVARCPPDLLGPVCGEGGTVAKHASSVIVAVLAKFLERDWVNSALSWPAP